MLRKTVFAAVFGMFGLMLLALPRAAAQSDSTPVLGLAAVSEALPWFDRQPYYPEFDRKTWLLEPRRVVGVTSLNRQPLENPVALRLSRYVYPAADGHLDAIVRFDLALDQVPAGHLHVALKTAQGQRLSEAVIDPIPGSQILFAYRFPENMAGDSGVLDIRWLKDAETVGAATAEFRVAPREQAPDHGRIRIRIDNSTGARMATAPVTVGVPFPRGALDRAADLRLVDQDGREIPVQVRETARWSRFGSIKWVLCDFTTALDGGPCDLFLEYGPEVTRAQREPMAVTVPREGIPAVDAGRLRLDRDGLNFDAAGDGTFRNVLPAAALTGAFVRHVNNADYVGWGHRWMSNEGTLYEMPDHTAFEIEETGPEKTVLRAAQWYVNRDTGARFCQFVTRWVLHRNSPVLRILHTWIFTGDGNRDRIRNMGWRFALNDMEPAGFLTGYGPEAEWLDGHYLRQEDAGRFTVFDLDVPKPRSSYWVIDDYRPARPIKEKGSGVRAPGVASARAGGIRLYLGIKDFWQNFPRSLKQEEGALTFYEWPQYGRELQHPLTGETMGDAWRLWFAHEGEVLNFALPQTLTEGGFYRAHSGPETRFLYGRPDSVNAQGVAKTAEMWVYLATDDTNAHANAGRVLQGLQDQSLRAVVDPEWVARSGAFHEIAPALPERYPAYEHAYAENARSALRQVERMEIYGKWLYGDLLSSPAPDKKTAGLNRARATSWGYPFSWIPFVHTGDRTFLDFAQAATTYLTDVAFCHYAGEELSEYFEALPQLRIWAKEPMFRRVGWWHSTNFIPWVGFWGPTSRMINDGAEWLWPAWFLTGHYRARDIALTWAAQTKLEEDLVGRGAITAGWNRGRWPVNLQKQYLEMWEATWDPWFLAAARAIADMQLWQWREKEALPHIWHTGPGDFVRYTGDPEYQALFAAHARRTLDWQYTGWANCPSLIIPVAALQYALTGDRYSRRRLAGIADLHTWSLFRGESPRFGMGEYMSGGTAQNTMQTSWSLKWFPLIIGALAGADGVQEQPIPLAFGQGLGPETRIAVRKNAGQEVTLRVKGKYRITGPEKDGQVRDGEADEVVLEAGAAAGTYLLDLGKRGVTLPLSPPDTPEVLLPGPEETISGGSEFGQYWFRVPAQTRAFRIEFSCPRYINHEWLRQWIVWTPDGTPAWVYRQCRSEYDSAPKDVVAELSVRPEHAGRLWRVTLPRRGGVAFRLDAQIPRVLALAPGRWFEPEAHRAE